MAICQVQQTLKSLKLASAGYNLLSVILCKNMCDVFIPNFVLTQPLRQLCGRGLHTFSREREGAQFFCSVDKHTIIPESSTFTQVSAGSGGSPRRSTKRTQLQPALGTDVAGLSCSSSDKQSQEEQASLPGRRNRKC